MIHCLLIFVSQERHTLTRFWNSADTENGDAECVRGEGGSGSVWVPVTYHRFRKSLWMNKEGEYWDVEKPGCLSEGKESTFQKENMKLSRQKKLIEINDAQRVIYAVI